MSAIVFCHGIPGSDRDATLLQAANPHADIVALDLLGIGPQTDDLVKSIEMLSDGKPVHLIGFSIGAMAAIKIAAARPALVAHLTLVSPAAPLSTGDFLPDMAGKAIFDLAMKHPKTLRLVTRVQGVLAKLAPNVLIDALFRQCGPLERELLNDPAFRDGMSQSLTNSFSKETATYLEYIFSYTDDWSEALPLVQCPIDLWHGTQDTWSPPAMSQRLAELLGGNTILRQVQDAEHYSTLKFVEIEPPQS